MPFYYLVLFYIFFILFSLVKKRKLTKQSSVIITAMIFIFNFIQPDATSKLIALISCRHISDYDYISARLTDKCYTSQFN